MTDREELLDLLKRFGLTPSDNRKWSDNDQAVVLSAKEGGVDGYSGFHARFAFDDDGKFEKLNIWE